METYGNNEVAVVRQVGKPVFEMGRWLRFLGILMITMSLIGLISTVIIVLLSMFGTERLGFIEGTFIAGFSAIILLIPIGIYIWMGILLNRAGKLAEPAFMLGDKDLLVQSLSNLKTYFIIMGILTLIGLLTTVAGICMGSIFGIWSSTIGF